MLLDEFGDGDGFGGWAEKRRELGVAGGELGLIHTDALILGRIVDDVNDGWGDLY